MLQMPYNFRMDPLPLGPEQPKREEIRLLQPFDDLIEDFESAEAMVKALECRDDADAALMLRTMNDQMAAMRDRIGRAGLSIENLRKTAKGSNDNNDKPPPPPSPNIRLIEVPPACLDTSEGVAEFASTLPAMRVAFRVGAWPHLWALVRCWAGYVLARGIVALRVPEAWRIVRVK